jgi:hypothetical protein
MEHQANLPCSDMIINSAINSYNPPSSSNHLVELDIISTNSPTMYLHSLTPIIPLLAALAPTTSAHGSHAPPVLNAEGIDDRNYMQKHVSIPLVFTSDRRFVCDIVGKVLRSGS